MHVFACAMHDLCCFCHACAWRVCVSMCCVSAARRRQPGATTGYGCLDHGVGRDTTAGRTPYSDAIMDDGRGRHVHAIWCLDATHVLNDRLCVCFACDGTCARLAWHGRMIWPRSVECCVLPLRLFTLFQHELRYIMQRTVFVISFCEGATRNYGRLLPL